MRSDLSLAALMLGRRAEARRYLAYTGAGRITESPFASAISMDPPSCGEETGLNPNDFAVVEFGIADDGSVTGAQTVYSQGGPKVAAAFARAVSEWYWLPESLTRIPPFYRLVTRVELRCSTADGSAPGIAKPISDRFTEWALPLLDIDRASATDQDSAIALLRERVARPEQPGDARQRIAASGQLALLDPRRNAQTVASLDRAIEIAGANGVEAEIVNSLRVMRLMMLPFTKVKGSTVRFARIADAEFQTLIDDPAIAQDVLALNTVRLLWSKRNTETLRQVADDNRLAEQHPLRQVALLALANDAKQSGNYEIAHRYFERTGLTEEQCALIGMRPEMKRGGASSSDYPDEALRMGFEGWVNLEFDVTADGKTADARAVIAYPPFVFVDAATKMASGMRYESTYRPEGGIACNAQRETIKFILGF